MAVSTEEKGAGQLWFLEQEVPVEIAFQEQLYQKDQVRVMRRMLAQACVCDKAVLFGRGMTRMRISDVKVPKDTHSLVKTT